MYDNFAAYERFQVLGQNLQNFRDGFGTFTLLASKIMIEEKLGTEDRNGIAQFDPKKWYPLRNNLRAFFRIQNEYGGYILRQMAAVVPKYAQFPPTVVDVHSALASLDVAFHLNHGLNDAPLLSLETGAMKEGIGHYTCKPVPGKKQILVMCDNPYPCDFDQGLILALAQRFEPTSLLVHQNPLLCRNKGAPSCTYSVTWR